MTDHHIAILDGLCFPVKYSFTLGTWPQHKMSTRPNTILKLQGALRTGVSERGPGTKELAVDPLDANTLRFQTLVSKSHTG